MHESSFEIFAQLEEMSMLYVPEVPVPEPRIAPVSRSAARTARVGAPPPPRRGKGRKPA